MAIASASPIRMIVGQKRWPMTSVTGVPRNLSEYPRSPVRVAVDVGDQLVGDQRLVEPPGRSDLFDLGLGEVRIPEEDALRRARHHPEQDEVEQDDRQDGDDRLPSAAREVPSAHARWPARSIGGRRPPLRLDHSSSAGTPVRRRA